MALEGVGSNPINCPHMYLIINLTSSNLTSINNLNEIILNKIKNINNVKIFKSYIVKSKNKKKFTVLKSPHVNKDAREQFEIRNYTRIMEVYSYQPLLLLFIIKCIKNKLNSDVKLHINFKYSLNQFYKHLKSNLNINNSFIHKNSVLNHDIFFFQNYLKSLDTFGELLLKKQNEK